MGLVKVTLTETTRGKLGAAATALCWICVFPSLVLAALGAYIQIVVQEKVKFLQNYNGEALTVFLVCLGVINVCANVIGGKFSHLNIIVRKRDKYKQLLFIYNCISSVLTACIFVAAIACFAHVTHLMESFQTGISSAMTLYKSDKVIKEELDDLQITYQCCGSGKYSDWFHVSWINEDYLYAQLAAVKKKMTTGEYLNDDVPFSCCDPKSHRPCISHHVHDNDLHYNYDYRTKTTLYNTGCTEALMQFYGRKVMGNVGAVFLTIFVIQCVAMICVRFFQSSIDDAYRKGDPTGPGEGCLFSWNFGEKSTSNVLTLQPSAEKETLLNTFDSEDDEVMSVDFDTFDEGCDDVGTVSRDLPVGTCYPDDEGQDPPLPPPPPSRYRSLNRLTSQDAMCMPHSGAEGYMPPPTQNLSRYRSMNRLSSRNILPMQQEQPDEEGYTPNYTHPPQPGEEGYIPKYTHPPPPPSLRRYSSVNRIASRDGGSVSPLLTSPPPPGNSIDPPPPPPPLLPF